MTPEPEDSIRAAGLRVTTQRLAVLQALTELPHAGAEAVHQRVRQSQPDITVQSVYVVLASLTEAGLIRAHRAGRFARAVRAAHRRQSPPRHLHRLRRGARRRLRHRARALPRAVRLGWFRDGHGRGDLLGAVPGMPDRGGLCWAGCGDGCPNSGLTNDPAPGIRDPGQWRRTRQRHRTSPLEIAYETEGEPA